MKNIKLIMGMMTAIMMLAAVCTPAGAGPECVGGTLIKSNVSGTSGAPSTCTAEKCPSPVKTFCKSNETMNWWTAFNWCKSNGGTLANFTSMCPDTPIVVNNVDGACPALQGVGSSAWMWSSLGYGSNSAIRVNLSSGAVGSTTRHANPYAFCE